MNNPWVHIAKYGVVGLIWSGVLVLAIFIALSSGSAGTDGGSSNIIGLGIAAFVAGAIATGFILGNENKTPQKELSTAKEKNDQRSIDPMSLLTDSDIAELRAEMKDNLRRRMMEDAEETSFESLLSNTRQKDRR